MRVVVCCIDIDALCCAPTLVGREEKKTNAFRRGGALSRPSAPRRRGLSRSRFGARTDGARRSDPPSHRSSAALSSPARSCRGSDARATSSNATAFFGAGATRGGGAGSDGVRSAGSARRRGGWSSTRTATRGTMSGSTEVGLRAKRPRRWQSSWSTFGKTTSACSTPSRSSRERPSTLPNLGSPGMPPDSATSRRPPQCHHGRLGLKVEMLSQRTSLRHWLRNEMKWAYSRRSSRSQGWRPSSPRHRRRISRCT